MRKTELVSIVRSLLPPGTSWPSEYGGPRFEGGKTVLMLVARESDPQLAVKLIDLVCHHYTADFWARDSYRRHVIMDACHRGVDPLVLQRLIKWARKTSFRVIVPMSRQDVNGLDAVELAINGGHGLLASCLLEQHGPSSHDGLVCKHYPLRVLEFAIESGNEQCARDVLANKRVVHHLQPGAAVRLNLIARWEQRRDPVKRLYNVFTCVGAAVRCGMPDMVRAIYELNPVETRRAAWYAVHKLESHGHIEVAPEIRLLASAYMLDMLWPQIREIIAVRHWELLVEGQPKLSLWTRIRRLWRHGHHDWEAIASHPWTTLPSEVMTRIMSFLLPSETSEMRKTAFLVEYSLD
ncbi:hypothetical protein PR003_g11869 [Phytophthora rubi]|uniref:SOCS box domain-containing protein n=1 Tax=Phytophthora rubi TaxID=129364 RepID=A0A6A3N0U1_9STRA|nr:hypothetical protein PR002_g7975 [Phytophthora rubi]KAE9039089.1 hypothetical protein PR001_g7674 [Phytophthora rubi]KAE9337702.1 hypothetical protein PR003_g11869 [Phytophthora rubi]